MGRADLGRDQQGGAEGRHLQRRASPGQEEEQMSPGAINQMRASAIPGWPARPSTMRCSTRSTDRASATASAIDWRARGSTVSQILPIVS